MSISWTSSNRLDDFRNKRENARFKVRPGATVRTYNNSVFGPVFDISLSGLAFHYVDAEYNADKDDIITLAIPGSDLFMDDLPVKIIYDVEVPAFTEDDVLIESRCGLQFKELKQGYAFLLDRLITHHTLRKDVNDTEPF